MIALSIVFLCVQTSDSSRWNVVLFTKRIKFFSRRNDFFGEETFSQSKILTEVFETANSVIEKVCCARKGERFSYEKKVE